MKKVLLFAAAALATTTSFAQSAVTTSATAGGEKSVSERGAAYRNLTNAASKTTVLTDTLYFTTDSVLNGTATNLYLEFAAPIDSGFFYGVNPFGFKGTARLAETDLDNTGATDTTVQFLGWFSRWGGRVQTNSTKQVTFSFWKQDATKTAVSGRTKFFQFGKPGALISSKTVAATSLPTTGTAYFVYANAPVNGIAYNSYSGVTMNYNWAQTGTDTFGLRAASTAGTQPNYYRLEAGTLDTLISTNVYLQNATGGWISPRYDLNYGTRDPIIAPIVRIDQGPSSVKGYRANELTVFGAFPNPAATTANFKFSLKSAAGVKFQVYDFAGRMIASQDLGQLSAGEQIVPQNVQNLPSGAYIFTVETTNGDAVATMVDVKH